MTTSSARLTSDKPRLLRWVFLTVLVYFVSVLGLWWLFPPQPRFTIGPTGERFVGFSPDGQTIATVGRGGVRLTEVRTGQVRRWLGADLPWSWVREARFSPDGRYFAALNHENQCLLWEVATGQLKTRIDAFVPQTLLRGKASHSHSAFRFTPDAATLVVVGPRETDLQFYDVPTNTLRATLSGIRRFTFAPDGFTLAVTEPILTVRRNIWSGKLLEQFGIMGDPLPPLAHMLPNVLPSLDCLRLRDVVAGQLIGAPLAVVENVTALTFSPDGRQLAVSTEKSQRQAQFQRTEIRRWEVATRKEIPSFDCTEPGSPSPWAAVVRFSPDNTKLLVLHLEGFTVWNLGLTPPQRALPFIGVGAISSDLRCCAMIAGEENMVAFKTPLDQLRLRLVDVHTRKEIGLLPGDSPLSYAWPLAFSADNRWVAVKLKYENGVIPFREMLRKPARFLPSEDLADFNDEISEVRVFETATGRDMGTIPEPGHGTTLSPDGSAMVVQSGQGATILQVWDIPPATPWSRILAWAVVPLLFIPPLGLWRAWQQWRARRREAALSLVLMELGV